MISSYWNDLLKRHPIEATMFVGDHRYDDRMNDPSLAAFRDWLDSLRKTRQALSEIDPKELNPTERIDRDVLSGMMTTGSSSSRLAAT